MRTMMKNKKGRYIIRAINSGLKTADKIVEYVQSNREGYISTTNIKHIIKCLENKGYIVSRKIAQRNEYDVVKEVSGQIDVKL